MTSAGGAGSARRLRRVAWPFASDAQHKADFTFAFWRKLILLGFGWKVAPEVCVMSPVASLNSVVEAHLAITLHSLRLVQ
jgi:hypothetical protein